MTCSPPRTSSALFRVLRASAVLSALAIVSVSTAGCADEPFLLEGSLSELYPLRAQDVRARLYPSELSIEFTRDDGQVPVRVTVRRAERDPSGAGDIDLGAFGDVTGSTDGVELPPFVSGTLTLDRYRPRDGAAVEGAFDARFRAGDTLVDLHGEFVTTLTVAE